MASSYKRGGRFWVGYYLDGRHVNRRHLLALAWDDGTPRWTTTIDCSCWPQNATVVAIPEGVVVNARGSIAMYSHQDGSLLRRRVFKHRDFRPMFEITDKFLFTLVSENVPSGERERGLLIALNRADWSTHAEWCLSGSAKLISRPVCADSDSVYVADPLRRFRVFGTATSETTKEPRDAPPRARAD